MRNQFTAHTLFIAVLVAAALTAGCTFANPVQPGGLNCAEMASGAAGAPGSIVHVSGAAPCPDSPAQHKAVR